MYFRACLPPEEKHLPGGSSVKGPGILAYNFDWPPWKSAYAVDTSNQTYTYGNFAQNSDGFVKSSDFTFRRLS